MVVSMIIFMNVITLIPPHKLPTTYNYYGCLSCTEPVKDVKLVRIPN